MSPRNYSIHSDVVAEAVGNELLLVQLAQGSTFRLNRTGRAVWELLAAGCTAEQVAERLHTQLGVAREQLAEDTSQLLSDLLEHGLIELKSQGAE